MPSYEASLLVRTLSKPELATALHRIGRTILDKRGIITAIENLGHRQTPYTIRSKTGPWQKQANYFVIKFNSDFRTLEILRDEYDRDVDIIKHAFFRPIDDTAAIPACTIEEEMQPPVYRQEVQEMLKKVKRNKYTKIFKYNSGLSYYPFQK